jgi:hypothetical protein
MGGWYELLEDGRTRPTSDGRPSPLGDDAVIARDEVAGLWSTTTVSTVFLGLDHSWDDGPPLLFETMIFGGYYDEYPIRYATIQEARAGHRRVVRRARLAAWFLPQELRILDTRARRWPSVPRALRSVCSSLVWRVRRVLRRVWR